MRLQTLVILPYLLCFAVCASAQESTRYTDRISKPVIKRDTAWTLDTATYEERIEIRNLEVMAPRYQKKEVNKARVNNIDKPLYVGRRNSSNETSGQFIELDGRYARDGYEVTLNYHKKDTALVVDPVTGDQIMKVRQHVLNPVVANGEPIYHYADVTKHSEQRRDREPLEDYILHKLAKRLKALPDGSYRIKMDNMVVNKDGEIVYYELDGIVGIDGHAWYRDAMFVPATIKLPIDNEVKAIVNNAPSLKPAKINGKRVYYFADVYLGDIIIDMKDGKPTFLFRDMIPL